MIDGSVMDYQVWLAEHKSSVVWLYSSDLINPDHGQYSFMVVRQPKRCERGRTFVFLSLSSSSCIMNDLYGNAFSAFTADKEICF